jgi:transposase
MKPTRFIGLDIHKHYLVAMGVDPDQQQVYGPKRVEWPDFEAWIGRELCQQDAVSVEMTTNTWLVHDTLLPHIHSVTVVHPQHVRAIVGAQVKTDKKAALTLAQLLAANLLRGIWVPDQYTRDLRALVAQRDRIASLGAVSKNRLHAVIHRYHLQMPEHIELFHPDLRPWWGLLNVPELEKVRIESYLDTLAFAEAQKKRLDEHLAKAAAQDARIPLLVQLPGVAFLTAITILAAIGDIRRFPDGQHLVGYAGLGARVHDSGELHARGRITKAGRRDLRGAMVDAANHAVQHHPFWKKELARLEPRLGRSKAIVAIARKLLMAVWHILYKEIADKHAEARDVACSFFAHAYKVKVKNLGGLSAKDWTRRELDRLGIGRDLQEIPWGTKKVKLPPSTLS